MPLIGKMKIVGVQWEVNGGTRITHRPDKATRRRIAEANFGKPLDEYLDLFKPQQ